MVNVQRATEGKWKIMFFSFDYVIKEMVNVAAVQLCNHGVKELIVLRLLVQFILTGLNRT